MRRESRNPLRYRANLYAKRQWVPSSPSPLKINSLMYYAYIAGYDRRKREERELTHPQPADTQGNAS